MNQIEQILEVFLHSMCYTKKPVTGFILVWKSSVKRIPGSYVVHMESIEKINKTINLIANFMTRVIQ